MADGVPLTNFYIVIPNIPRENPDPDYKILDIRNGQVGHFHIQTSDPDYMPRSNEVLVARIPQGKFIQFGFKTGAQKVREWHLDTYNVAEEDRPRARDLFQKLGVWEEPTAKDPAPAKGKSGVSIPVLG